jgi:GAF domain-containing protein
VTSPNDQPTQASSSAEAGSADSQASGSAGPWVPELVSLLLTTRSVEDFLGELARAAAGALDASCGITVRRDGRPMTVASSDALANQVDEVQYGAGQGPCLQSLATGQVVSVPDLAVEQRWDGYPAHALAYGIGSSLSLPMSTDSQTIGALNLYSRAAHAFDEPADLTRSAALAGQGSAVLSVALRQAQQAQLSEQLREALSSRSVIDQAIGILMAQQRCTARAAFAVLRGASQNRNRKLRDIATDVVTSIGGPPETPPAFNEPD